MASIQKHGTGWRAFVARQGVRRTKVFPTKTEAKDWAARQEYLILQGEGEHGPGTFGTLLDRYAREVSPKKRGARWEQIRLEKIGRDKLARIDLKNLRPGDFADWRDRRLREVSASSVRRELQLLSGVCAVASREWGLLQRNPLADVTKPPNAQPRSRRVSPEELAALYATARSPKEREAIRLFEIAIETGMRAGEILNPDKIVAGRVCKLPMTKNGKRREVPLSARAAELLALPITLDAATRDTLFRRVRDRAGIEGLTFHDSRHEAVTRLSAILRPLELARMVGHSDLKMLLTYYDETAEQIAAKLDQRD